MPLDNGNIVRGRAPLRLGLAGGGTDLSPYSDKFGGAVLNCTIAKFAHVSISRSRTANMQFLSRDLNKQTEVPFTGYLQRSVEAREFMLVCETLKRVTKDFMNGEIPPLRIETAIDAPMGSGLGSSSALVVAIVEALAFAFDLPLGQFEVARLAWEIERQDLKLAGGKQDQYAASFGGLNFMEFLAEGRVVVNPLRLSNSAVFELEASLLIAYSGISRRSEMIIDDQVRSTSVDGSSALNSLHSLKEDAFALKAALLRRNVHDIAEILNKSWRAKKQTSSSMTTPEIDLMYEAAMEAGALGGKISGAGGGGFFIFFVDPDKREAVRRGLEACGAVVEYVTLFKDGAHAWAAPCRPSV